MKPFRSHIIVLLITFFSGNWLGRNTVHAQNQRADTVFLMNGNIVCEKIVDTLLGAVSVRDPKKPDRLIHYEWDQLYKIRYATGKQRFYYSQDTTVNNWFTREEMWLYIRGERDARAHFKGRGSLIGAGITGLAGGLTGTFWAPALPVAYMALTGIPKVRIRPEMVSDPYLVDHDAYLMGFIRVAKQKRINQAIIGGSVGLATGYLLYFILGKYYL